MKKKIYKYKLNRVVSKLSNSYKTIFGNYGIKSLNNGLLNSKHIENIRRKLSKQFKKINNINKTKIFIKLNSWKPYTNKPMLSRMGKGAGAISKWQTFIRKGIIFIELSTTEKQKQINFIVKKSMKNFPLKIVLIKK